MLNGNFAFMQQSIRLDLSLWEFQQQSSLLRRAMKSCLAFGSLTILSYLLLNQSTRLQYGQSVFAMTVVT